MAEPEPMPSNASRLQSHPPFNCYALLDCLSVDLSPASQEVVLIDGIGGDTETQRD